MQKIYLFLMNHFQYDEHLCLLCIKAVTRNKVSLIYYLVKNKMALGGGAREPQYGSSRIFP